MVKSRFRSRSEHVLDTKGRLNFPARFREVLRQQGPEILMIAPWKTHLRGYLIAEWESLETKLLTEGADFLGTELFVRYVIGGVVDVNLDKQGRIALPLDLRNDVGLDREVVVTGMVNWFEIWDKELWAAEKQAIKDNFGTLKKDSLTKIGVF
ncbi:MAG: division/cell wall cluster transcriptional repressor MraZ [Desulfobacterales bacterium]|nr:MAG: division/cell wall cluster transcriptional repressor MraZ [Desulfobacterales bacterium]